MKYFAYGSNMSLKRLAARTPSVKRLGQFTLAEHQLKFHKASHDGSGKCDAFYTGNKSDVIYGALYEICPNEKVVLDEIEGLGLGYEEKLVTVSNASGEQIEALTYYATDIEPSMKPYQWYLNHVIVGAGEIQVPEAYFNAIKQTPCTLDSDNKRTEKENGIYR